MLIHICLHANKNVLAVRHPTHITQVVTHKSGNTEREREGECG